MALTLADLYASPDHYLHSWDGADAVFVPMNRAAYHRSIFLDGRISAAGSGQMRVSAPMLLQAVPRPAATGWIFHVAHCGSTLLARALDALTGNLVLREPLALRQLGLAPDRARLDLTLAMLSRRYEPGLPTIIKANVPVNFILPSIAAADGAAAAILLHTSLPDYLLAILRDDEHREWMRRVTAQLALHLGDLSALPDAERAAALWLAQRRAFAGALGRMPGARTLDAETFYAAPRRALAAAATHLSVPLDDAALDAIVAGPIFSTYSKRPDMPFDNEARLRRRATLADTLAPEIAQAQSWLARTSDAAGSEASFRRAALVD